MGVKNGGMGVKNPGFSQRLFGSMNNSMIGVSQHGNGGDVIALKYGMEWWCGKIRTWRRT